MNEQKKIFDLYSIEPSKKYEGKNFWRRVGVAFLNRDGSLNVKSNVNLSPEMKLQLRERTRGAEA